MASSAAEINTIQQSVFNYIFSREQNPIFSGLQITFSFNKLGRGVVTFWAEKTYHCFDFLTGEAFEGEMPTVNPMLNLYHCSPYGELIQKLAATLLRVTSHHAQLESQIHSDENKGTVFDYRNTHYHIGSTLDEDPSSLPLTPKQLQCWLSQIVGFQEKLQFRRELTNSPLFAEQTQWIRDFCRNGVEVLTEIKSEVDRPFIPRQAVKDILIKYSDFYRECYGNPGDYSAKTCYAAYPEKEPQNNSSNMFVDVQAILAITMSGLWVFSFSVMLGLLDRVSSRLGMEQSQIDRFVNSVYLNIAVSVFSLSNANLALIVAAMLVQCVVYHFNRDNSVAIASSMATLSAGEAILNTVSDNMLPAIAIGVTQGVISCALARYGFNLTSDKSSADRNKTMSKSPSTIMVLT